MYVTIREREMEWVVGGGGGDTYQRFRFTAELGLKVQVPVY